MNHANEVECGGKLKSSLRFVLVVVLIATLFLPYNLQAAYGEPTSAEVQAQADEVSARIAAAEEEMIAIRAEYWSAVEAHYAALAGMEEAQAHIDAAEAVIRETQDRLGNRANQMYRQGPFSYLNVLFGAASFEEFTTSWDLLNAINLDNANLIQANKDARAEAQAAHEVFSAQRRVAAEREAEAAAIQARAEELIAQQKAELDGLNAEVAELVAKEEAARRAAEEEAARLAYENELRNRPPSGPGSGYIPPDIPGGGYSDVVSAAASRIGCPYVWGAAGPDCFDCSGLTSWCYLQAGLGWIGRTDSNQYNNARARWSYAENGAAPGDVLWWPGHVAIYAGGGSYIHAPVPGQYICYSSWNIGAAVVLRF